MKQFEVLDISGDIGLKAFGKSLKEAFINVASGMYSLITKLDAIEKKKTINISLEKHSLDALLVSWLNELIFYFDAYGFIGKKIVIEEASFNTEEFKLKAKISGEEIDPERHERKLLIKAATYHRLRIEKRNNFWEIDVIFDI
ncbi:MAG: archease [Nitrospirae bacterium]|nr:archease [Nitrospirota bacterium]